MLSLRYSVGSFHKDNYNEDESSIHDTNELNNSEKYVLIYLYFVNVIYYNYLLFLIM